MTHDNQARTQDANAFARHGAGKLAYIKPIGGEDLIEQVPEARSEIDLSGVYFSLHAADGSRIGLAADRDSALALAKAHNVRPVSVH